MSDRGIQKDKNNSKHAAEGHHHHHHQKQQEKRDMPSKPDDSAATDSFLKRYQVIEKIGEGSYSEVLKCQNRFDGTVVACKRLKHIYKSWNDVNNIAEIATLRTIERHANILQMIEIHYDETLGKVSLVFELMEVNLYELIKDRKNRILPENRVRKIMFQLFRALRHLHKLGIFHRDIKPENILIKNEGEHLKLGDLGSVRGMFSKAPYTEYISTRWYRSPECLLTAGHYSHKMDIWAAGCVFFEVLTLRPLFPGSSELDQINKIHGLVGAPPMKLLETFQKQADLERETYRGQNQLNRRQQIQKVLDGYSTRYIMAHDSKNSSSKSIKSSNRNAIEYNFPGKENQLEKHMPPFIPRDAREIIKACLSYDPELRPTAHRVIHLSYFYEMRESSSKTSEKVVSKPVVTICGENQVEPCGTIDLRTLGDNKIRYRRGHQVKVGKQPSKQVMPVKKASSVKPEVNNNYIKNSLSPNENSVVSRSRSRVSNVAGGSKQTSVSTTNIAASNKTPSKASNCSSTSKSHQASKHNRGRQVEQEIVIKPQPSKVKVNPSIVVHKHAEDKTLHKKQVTSSTTSSESLHSTGKKYKYGSNHQLQQKENSTGAIKEIKSTLAVPFADIALSPYVKAPSELKFLQKKIKGDQHSQTHVGRKPLVAVPNLAPAQPHKSESVKMTVVPPKVASASIKYAKSSNASMAAASSSSRKLRQVFDVNNNNIETETRDGVGREYSPLEDEDSPYATASSVKIGKLRFTQKQPQQQQTKKTTQELSPNKRSKIPLLSPRGNSQKSSYKSTKLTSPPEPQNRGRGMAAATTGKWRNTGIPRRIQPSPDPEREKNIRILRESLTLDEHNRLQIHYQHDQLLNKNAANSTKTGFRMGPVAGVDKNRGKNNAYEYSSIDSVSKKSQPRLTGETGSSVRYLNSTTDYENHDMQETASSASVPVVEGRSSNLYQRSSGGRVKVPPDEQLVKPTPTKKPLSELYPQEVIDVYSSRYRGPDANMNILKTSSNYVKHGDSRTRTQEVKEKLNHKIEQRRRQQINPPSVGVGDHPSKLTTERSSSFLFSSNEYNRQHSTTMVNGGGRAVEEQQYARPTMQKTGRVERRPPIPPGKLLGLRQTTDVRSNRVYREPSPDRISGAKRDELPNPYHNQHQQRRASIIPSTNIEKTEVTRGGGGNHIGRRSYSNAAAEQIRKDFRDTQRKRTERMKSTMRDEVFCSSDDDVVISMRKKFDSLISERARKLSECLKTNVVSNAASNEFRNACDSDDDLLADGMPSQMRNAALPDKGKLKYARRELRARMAESLTMNNRFASMHWRIPETLNGGSDGPLDENSGDCIIQPSYKDSMEDKSSKYMQEKIPYKDDYQKNLKYQQSLHSTESSRIYPYSRQDQNSNRNGQIYTPPGNKPVYQSPQIGVGNMLHERKLRYSHNIQVPRIANNNNDGSSYPNYSQRGRNIKEVTTTDMKNRQRQRI